MNRNLKLAGQVLSGAFELVVVLEILWYYTHDGEQTLHDAAVELWDAIRARMEERGRIRSTLDMIRDLPESDK